MPGNYYYLPQPYNEALSVYDIDVAPSTNITTLLQAAIDNASNSVVRIMKPGTYLLSASTANPYWSAQLSYTCILINRSNITIEIGPGVTLKMADNTQTNSFNYMFVWRSKDNIHFRGGGTLDMNSINQPSFDNPYEPGTTYGQEAGGIIRGFFQAAVANDGSTNITVENLTLNNTFGNPVNVYGNRPASGDNNIHFRNLKCQTFGEGLQIVGMTNVSMVGCHLYDPLDVARGDGFEFSVCDNFQCVRNYIKGSGNGGDQGSGIDLYSSVNGIVADNIIDGWNEAINFYFAVGSPRVKNIKIVNNQFLNVRAGYALSAGNDIEFSNNLWQDITTGNPGQTTETNWASCTATASGTTITVTIASHGFLTGELISIRGANETGCNGTFKLTKLTANTLSYTATSAPGGNPTGTLTYRHGLTSVKHTSDKFVNCATIQILGGSDVRFVDCDFIGGTADAVTIYESAMSFAHNVTVAHCRFYKNTSNAIIVTGGGGAYAPECKFVDNEFVGNGGTITGYNGGSLALCTIRGNVGHPDPAMFSISDLDDLENWYREDMGMFQNTAKTTAAALVDDPVRVWEDSLGNGPDLIAPNDGARPLRDANGGIVGNGSSKYLRSDVDAFDASGPHTIILRIRARDTYPYSDVVMGIQKSTTELYMGAFQSATAYVTEEDDAAIETLSTTPAADIVFGYAVDGSGNRTLYKSDGTTASGVYATTLDATATLFLLAISDSGSPPLPSSYGTGAVNTVIKINRVITATEFRQIQLYYDSIDRPFNGDYYSLTNVPAVTTASITDLGTGVSTWLATPSSANLAAAVTGETGSGALVFGTSPGFTTAANPVSSDGAALGTTSLMWSDLFLASGGVINWNNGDVTITHSANTLTFAGASSGYTFDAKVNLGTTVDAKKLAIYADASFNTFYGLGISAGTLLFYADDTLGISLTTTRTTLAGDLYLASTKKIDFGSGDITVTHATNSLTFAGASTGYFFDSKMNLGTAVEAKKLAVYANTDFTSFYGFGLSAGKTTVYANDSLVMTYIAGTPNRVLINTSTDDGTSALQVAGAITVGSGTAITKVLSATATLNFGSIAQDAYEDLTITVTGAASGDTVIANPVSGSATADVIFDAWVSAADTVTVRAINNGTVARDPASGTFRATVIKF